ncbi:MAG TPA: endonuclease domain-containing protein [Longimicrobium sp.]|nr:endonuclease domain-containing protein [Longimicrobium sp.]
MQEAAKELRLRMTEAERVLWSVLRRDQMGGLSFRRQHAIGPFILDFYCPAVRLGIELDGPIHDRQRELDHARTEGLGTLQIRILRFRNEQVISDLESVVREIQYAIGRAQAA